MNKQSNNAVQDEGDETLYHFKFALFSAIASGNFTKSNCKVKYSDMNFAVKGKNLFNSNYFCSCMTVQNRTYIDQIKWWNFKQFIILNRNTYTPEIYTSTTSFQIVKHVQNIPPVYLVTTFCYSTLHFSEWPLTQKYFSHFFPLKTTDKWMRPF